MDLRDFSDSFDTLASSYAHQATPGEQSSPGDADFDEYEKSIYLTKSQEELALSLYSGKNAAGDSFESSEELRRYLSPLVGEESLEPVDNSSYRGMESYSKFFSLPDNLWFITYEGVTILDGMCEGHTTLDVYPVTQDEYHKIKNNPFRGANDRRALRLDLSDGMIEVVSKYNVSTYYIRYVRKPRPIILTDLPDGLNIDGRIKATQCELHPALHRRILERAVVMALQSRGRASNS